MYNELYTLFKQKEKDFSQWTFEVWKVNWIIEFS